MIDLLFDLLTRYKMIDSLANFLAHLIFIAGIILVSWLANLITRKLILKFLACAVEKTRNQWDDIFYAKKVFNRLSQIAPAFIIFLSASEFPVYQNLIEHMSSAYMILVTILVVNAILDAIVGIYGTFEISKIHPIKGYMQVSKIFVSIIGGILIISVLIQQSPWILLSGMGAVMAIILLVFKDTLLGLVASVQLSGNDMVRIGDWIEVPQYGADGDVIDISLHTVKIQNWDKTITTVPAYALVSESFKNWRGMQVSGGRRIKRTVYIDMTSIKFCTEEMLERFEQIQLIREYIQKKRSEIETYNLEHDVDTSNLVNGRRLTNIGTFRAYLQAYLQHHPKLNKNMTMLVRHLAPTEHGIPLEIYVFSSDLAWANYEAIQADIFDHILSVIPSFDLRVFQIPTGHDVKELIASTQTPDRPRHSHTEGFA